MIFRAEKLPLANQPGLIRTWRLSLHKEAIETLKHFGVIDACATCINKSDLGDWITDSIQKGIWRTQL